MIRIITVILNLKYLNIFCTGEMILNVTLILRGSRIIQEDLFLQSKQIEFQIWNVYYESTEVSHRNSFIKFCSKWYGQ